MNEHSRIANSTLTAEDLAAERAATYGTEAFLSADYAKAEKDLLWPRVWQMYRNAVVEMGGDGAATQGWGARALHD